MAHVPFARIHHLNRHHLQPSGLQRTSSKRLAPPLPVLTGMTTARVTHEPWVGDMPMEGPARIFSGPGSQASLPAPWRAWDIFGFWRNFWKYGTYTA